MDEIREKKKELRKWAMEKRQKLNSFDHEAVSRLICQHILEFVTFSQKPSPVVVSGFWPMDDEIDVTGLLHELHNQGHPICLPVVKRKGEALTFRSWSPGDSLMEASFGVQVPHPEAPEVFPRIVIAPLLAFDRQGYRLGYGGGFYDRTLQFLRSQGEVTAIGVAYSAQEVEKVPVNSFDQKLDAVVTEKEFLSIDV